MKTDPENSRIADIELVQLIRQGHKEGAGVLYDSYAGFLFFAIIRIVADHKLAEFVLLATFEKIWCSIDDYEVEKERIYSWMIAIARRLAYQAAATQLKIMKEEARAFTPTKDSIVVIGTSAGGMSASIRLLQQLGPEFPAPILLVQHISGDTSGEALLKELNSRTLLNCVLAIHGRALQLGYVYLAPPDHHLMVSANGHLQVTRGARENRSRPAIDPLFRSAAVAFGTKAIGIILSGYLDDGTAGLIAIQRCGGSCIIQDPTDAEYPDMPRNALNQVEPDFCLPIAKMGSAIIAILNRPLKKQGKIPKDIQREVQIAERVLGDLDSVNALGEQVPFNCPGCGGVLWKMTDSPFLRYRCFTGHAYTADSLLSEQTNKIEETMWTALRMFEERRNLLTTLAKDQSGAAARSSIERAESSQVHIDRIRAILLGDDNPNESENKPKTH